MTHRFQSQVEQRVRRRRIGDLDGRAAASLDKLVSERFHPAMAARPQKLLEGISREAFGPDVSPDTNVDKHRWLEASACFDGINGIDKLGRMVTPTVVAPSENRGGAHLGFGNSSLKMGPDQLGDGLAYRASPPKAMPSWRSFSVMI